MAFFSIWTTGFSYLFIFHHKSVINLAKSCFVFPLLILSYFQWLHCQNYLIVFSSIMACVLVLCLGLRWQGGSGETAQGKHQEAERNGGAAGEGTEWTAYRY